MDLASHLLTRRNLFVKSFKEKDIGDKVFRFSYRTASVESVTLSLNCE